MGEIPPAAARLFALAGALAAGGFAAEAFLPAWWAGAATAAALLVFAGIARTRRGPAALVLLLAAAAAGYGLAGMRLAAADGGLLARLAERGEAVILAGEILGEPRALPSGLRLTLGVREVAPVQPPPVLSPEGPAGSGPGGLPGPGFAVRERISLTIRPPPPVPLESGDLIHVRARLSPPAGPSATEGARRAADAMRRAGVGARASAGPEDLQRTGRSSSPLAVVARAGRNAVSRAAAHLPEPERGLFLAVTVGDTRGLDPAVREDFRLAGLAHLLAVSGLHVGIVLGAAGLLVRLLPAGPRIRLGLLAALLLSYMAVTGFRPSVLRAGAMAALAIGAALAGARRDGLIALGVAAVGLLLYDPFLARSVGFQLSAAATAGILTLAPRLALMLPAARAGATAGGASVGHDGQPSGRPTRGIAGLATVSLAAQIATLPLLALHFRQVPLLFLPANLLALPAVAPATLGGLAAALGGAIWEPLAAIAGAVTPALTWMGWVARRIAALPVAAVGLPGGAAGAAIAAALVLLAGLTARLRRAGPLIAALLLAIAVTGWTRALTPPIPDGLTLVAFDVGQGDAFLVREPGGRSMLVDGGPDPVGALGMLRRAGVRRLDLVVLTHPHLDHVAGLPAVLRRLPVGRALDPGIDTPLEAYRAYLAALEETRVPRDIAVDGMRYGFGAATVEILGPPADPWSGSSSDVNNNSVVLRVAYGQDAILLTGDIQEEAQGWLTAAYPEQIRATILTVPHHGSSRMLPAFFEATGARVGVISVGQNPYGLPAPSTLRALEEAGIEVLRTDESGDVTVRLDGRGGIGIRAARSSFAASRLQAARDHGPEPPAAPPGPAVPSGPATASAPAATSRMSCAMSRSTASSR